MNFRIGWLGSLVLGLSLTSPGWAQDRFIVDKATVTVEKRSGRDWCVLDSQISASMTTTIDALWAVISRYESYPSLFADVREAKAEVVPGAVLLSEKVVISAMGIENINRFTLRLVRSDPVGPRRTLRLDWTQEKTDGTIDSLSGSWLLEDRGTAEVPVVQVTYRNRSAVPQVVFGQDVVIRMFLGDRMRNLVETVAKKASSR